ncbi:polysaccharide biosynthesis tyrosine autokinase [Qipengyuania gaetbuli]|uniref:GumC family protein n=1 Tax=Qipengyuania gaetbuli TaxID=266952 RepID=UPI001C990B18|nr:polysaccharide biosynthesis tyrosine autokinase [Qipengyuania gaetbuli]MBY6016099.1 polysaccharide biosynthesis tyrosine autokinase [Qipengyuania gaetbuli]
MNVRSARPDTADYYEDNAEGLRDLGVPVAERVWQTVKNNKWLIAILIAASLVIGVVATLIMTPKYQASARIEISRVENNVTAVEGVETQDQVLDAQYYETQYELLKSRSLAEQVVRQGKLASDDAFLKAFDIVPTDAGFARDPERALANVLLDNISISPVGSSNLVDIRFTSPSPAVSARIANLWANEYIASNLSRRFGATNEARQFLEGRIEQLRERLETAERELITYAAERNLFTIETPESGSSSETASQTLVASDLQALNTALAQATTERIAAQSALDATATALSPEDAAAIQPLRQRRAELSAQRAQLRATAGEEYPTVRALSEQISQLDREIAAAERRSGSAVRARFQQALETEQRLRARVNELRDEFVGQRRDSVQYNILQREVDTTQALYNSLLQRYREIGVAGVGENNIAMVDAAEVPSVPSEPNLLRNLLLSLLIGAAAAGGIILLREKLDQSVRDPAEVPELLGVPLLGSIPASRENNLADELESKHSELYEAYFNLFTTLGFLSENGVPKRLMLGSTRPAEGKTLSSVALAKILAERGKRVLLLDADMRHSGLSKYLDVSGGKGLSNYLRGEDDWQSLVQLAKPFNFELIPAGRQPPNAAELLAGDRFEEFLGKLEARYDHVIIDAPPVLGLADAPLIASAVEGVVMVVEANRGKVRMIAQALDRLERGGGKIFGAVVTKLDERNQSYGYGYGYGYGYSYGEKPKLSEVA